MHNSTYKVIALCVQVHPPAYLAGATLTTVPSPPHHNEHFQYIYIYIYFH
eukprot:NODE_6565_length_447_cov_13.291457_g5006_i0.p2 GENE.NODE_6565_length_447_cov_13.291457_g5006_i0~~NODE_6565_length_447_cov_13.291457_g5006_i0.p2  ORF type:complete len:50 (+),score=10.09 NODE_6565_length_447_cov_13.291457_g5006_i0:225-374(+)